MNLTMGHIKKAIAAAMSLVFVVWLTHQNDHSDLMFFQPLTNLPAWIGVFALFGLLSTYVLRGWRLAYEFREFKEMSLLKSIQVVLWHNASVNLLPFRSGEAAFPVLLHRIAQVPLKRSMASLLHLRMQDACSVLLLGIAFWPNLEMTTRLLTIGLTALVVIGFYRWLKATNDWQDSTIFIKRKLASFRHAMATENPNALQSWLLTFCNWIIKISVQALLYFNLAQIDFSSGVIATISSEIAAFSPVQGIAGIGTFEASSALALHADGVAWSTGMQVAAQVHLVVLSSALFWAFAAWLLPKLKIEKMK